MDNFQNSWLFWVLGLLGDSTKRVQSLQTQEQKAQEKVARLRAKIADLRQKIDSKTG